MHLDWVIIGLAGLAVLVMVWRLPQADKKLAEALRPSDDFAPEQEMFKEEVLLKLLDEWQENGVQPEGIALLLRNKRPEDLPACIALEDLDSPEVLRQKIRHHRNEV